MPDTAITTLTRIAHEEGALPRFEPSRPGGAGIQKRGQLILVNLVALCEDHPIRLP